MQARKHSNKKNLEKDVQDFEKELDSQRGNSSDEVEVFDSFFS